MNSFGVNKALFKLEYGVRREIHKGCSSFDTDGVEAHEEMINNVPYKTKKESCKGANCNKGMRKNIR